MTSLFSPNCQSSYHSVATVVAHSGSASLKGHENDDRCRVEPVAPMYSCQTTHMEELDASSLDRLKESVLETLGEQKCPGVNGAVASDVDVSMSMTQLYTPVMEVSAETMASRGSVSNCFNHGGDSTDVTLIGKAECNPTRDMLDVTTGKMVTSYTMKVSSELGVCDVTEEAQKQVEEDLRKLAAHNLLENRGYDVSPESLSCYFSFVPVSAGSRRG